MSTAVAARIQAEPGWKAVIVSTQLNRVIVTTHSIYGWAMVLASQDVSLEQNSSILFRGLPLSMTGEIMSNRPGYVTVIPPDSDEASFIETVRSAFQALEDSKLSRPQDVDIVSSP